MSAIPQRAPLGLWRLLVTGVFVAGAAILVAGLFTAFGSDNPDELGWDFRVAYFPAAESVVDGASPYPSPNDPDLDEARVYAYPPYSIADIIIALGLGSDVGHLVTFVVGGALIGTCVTLARRGDEQRAFIVAIASALALSPIVWLHYLVLLLVPLGLARPRFSAIWLLPVVLWMSPRSANGDGLEPFVPAVVAAILVVVLLVHPQARLERTAVAAEGHA